MQAIMQVPRALARASTVSRASSLLTSSSSVSTRVVARPSLVSTFSRYQSTVTKGSTCEGQKVPNVTFKTRVRDDTIKPNPFKWKDVTTDELFKGKKVVVLSLPGAFTPTCSSTHLPVYDQKIEEFKKLGVDSVICVSVNDAFVMYQWGQHLGVKNVFLLPDGNGEFTEKLGMLVKKNNLGFGARSWRYSMYVEDGVVKKQFIEKGFSDDHGEDPFSVSDAETMLKFLRERK